METTGAAHSDSRQDRRRILYPETDSHYTGTGEGMR